MVQAAEKTRTEQSLHYYEYAEEVRQALRRFSILVHVRGTVAKLFSAIQIQILLVCQGNKYCYGKEPASQDCMHAVLSGNRE